MIPTPIETLHDGVHTRVVRARDASGSTVVLKQRRGAWPDAAALRRLRREHDLLRRIDGHGAPTVLRMETSPVPQLVLADVGGRALDTCMEALRGDARTALTLALRLAEALGAVHGRGVVHRDLAPSNVLVDPLRLEAWLIDFDRATEAGPGAAIDSGGDQLLGTAPYLAPELTGRLNRRADARADLYALGGVLYALFGGAPPFTCADRIGYTHAHLALAPPPLQPVVDGLPRRAVDLVMALLQKSPDARYQSAEGVALDLRALRAELDGEPVVALRGRSLGGRAALPDEVAGRAAEIAALTAAFERARAGGREIALVTGPPGIGKTSVVGELTPAAAVAGGQLLSGKFDQFARDLPLTALSQVLEQFAREVLSAPAEVVEGWRRRLLDATSPNAQLLVDLAPGWALLLGPQPPVDDLAPTEAERRLQDTVRRALGAIASAEHPVVLFLDDLQWADLPSLRVLEALFGDPNLAFLLLVLAWRDAEVGPDHALHPTVTALAGADARVLALPLGPLSRADVQQLVARGLRLEPDGAATLADLLYAKTDGNPFFLRRLFEQAADTGAVRFDATVGGWAWDEGAVRALAAADNVVELLQAELRDLAPDARALLAAAALLGDTFDVQGLVHATGRSPAALAPGIEAAIAGRFVRPLDADYWSGGVDDGRGFRFAFVHDRVQQATGELLTVADRRAVHRTVARALLADADALQGQLFQAAEHCLAAADFVDAERGAVQQVLQRAGRRAMRGAAYAPAHRFLEAAIAAGDGWDAAPDDARELWTLAARAAWLVGRRDLLEAHVGTLRAHARGAVDRLRAEEIIVQARISAGDLHAALDAALAVMAEAGTTLPRKPTLAQVHAAVGGTLGALAGRRIEDIAAQLCDDPVEHAVRDLLLRITSAAYVAEGNLLPIIACHLVQRTLDVGASPASAYGFAVFALSLCAGWLLEQGVEQGRNARWLLERLPDRTLEGMVRHVVHHYARVWSDPLRQIHDEIPDVHRALMDAGDLEFAGWVHHFRVVYGFYSGVPLDVLSAEAAPIVAGMRLHGLEAARQCTLPMQHLVRGLIGETDDPSRLVAADYDEAAVLEALVAADFRAAALVLAVCTLHARVLFGDVPAAAEAARRVMGLQDGAVGLYYQIPMRLFAAVALLDAEGAAAIPEVTPWRAALAACAAVNPTSGGHLLPLFDAEVAAAGGDLAEAIVQYDAAIEAAARGGFVQDEAFANERAGRFHLRRRAHRIARAYLREARLSYGRWGATAKVAQLDATYAELALGAPADAAHPTSDGAPGAPARVADLDLETLLKASQAIAEEVALDALLRRSMRILLESVGARRGALLLVHRGALQVRAVGSADGEVSLFAGASFDDGAHVPPSVVRRVWRRGEAEVYADVRQAPGAAADPRLRARRRAGATSALCARFSHLGNPLGLLYFENDLAAGPFSPDRVRVLDVLAPQLAVSVRNARLHEAQDRFVPSQYLRSLNRVDIVDVELGDHQAKEVTVFFSDMRGFTSLVERMPPAAALEFVNHYMAFAEPAISGGGGFVDAYLGDGILALFDHPAHNAQDAVAASIAVHHALDRLNDERQRDGQVPVRTGIGLNTGRVILGTIGGPHAMKCGVVGDAVNLASRVEGLTAEFRVRLLLADTTVERLGPAPPFALRRAARVRVKGRAQPVTVHEVLDAEPAPVRDALLDIRDDYERAWTAYHAGRAEEARAGFEACLARAPSDPLCMLYRARADELCAIGVPAGWDGTASY